jgi:outer membrane protein assembly factor BamB
VTFVAGCDSILHAIDWRTGKESFAVELGGQAAATAAVLGENVYVGTMTNVLLGIDLTNKATPIQWSFEPKKSQPFYASAAVTDDLVVVGCRDKNVHAVKRKNGDLVWSFPTKNRVDSSPVIVGSRVYVGSSDGRLYVLDLARGALVQAVELGRAIVAGPAVSDDRLVVGTTDGWIVCLGKK